MLYGLYLSATGVMTNSYRQDVIANNLANAETVGFKKDMALFKERLTAAQEMRKGPSWTDPLMEQIGGGTFATPASVLRSEFVERANVDPAIELTSLMETQRQLEANANMIRYQDQTLGALVNTVGKIS